MPSPSRSGSPTPDLRNVEVGGSSPLTSTLRRREVACSNQRPRAGNRLLLRCARDEIEIRFIETEAAQTLWVLSEAADRPVGPDMPSTSPWRSSCRPIPLLTPCQVATNPALSHSTGGAAGPPPRKATDLVGVPPQGWQRQPAGRRDPSRPTPHRHLRHVGTVEQGEPHWSRTVHAHSKRSDLRWERRPRKGVGADQGRPHQRRRCLPACATDGRDDRGDGPDSIAWPDRLPHARP
jgi:hypothetical protein